MSAAAEERAAAGESAAVTEPPVPPAGGLTWGDAGLLAAGAASAFVVHESCHVAAGLAMGNPPTIQPVRFMGVVPFFAISPGVECSGGRCFKASGAPFGPGPRGLYLIVSAGILCQELTDEVILTTRPRLRYEDEPFLVGMLAFNTLASVGYAVANLLGIRAGRR